MARSGSTLSVSAIADLEVQMHRLMQMVEEANAGMCSSIKALASARRSSAPSSSPTSSASSTPTAAVAVTTPPSTSASTVVSTLITTSTLVDIGEYAVTPSACYNHATAYTAPAAVPTTAPIEPTAAPLSRLTPTTLIAASTPTPKRNTPDAEDDSAIDTPTKCSTIYLSRDNNMLKSVNALTTIWTEPSKLNTFPFMAALSLDINKCSSFENIQHRYITNCTPACSSDVMLHSLATEVYDSHKLLEGMDPLNPVGIDPLLAILVDKGAVPFILNVEQVTIPPKPPWLLVSLDVSSKDNFATWTTWMLWPHLLTLIVSVQFTPLPWSSFTNDTVVVWSSVSTRNMVKSLFGDISGWHSLHGLEFTDKCCWRQWEIPWVVPIILHQRDVRLAMLTAHSMQSLFSLDCLLLVWNGVVLIYYMWIDYGNSKWSAIQAQSNPTEVPILYTSTSKIESQKWGDQYKVFSMVTYSVQDGQVTDRHSVASNLGWNVVCQWQLFLFQVLALHDKHQLLYGTARDGQMAQALVIKIILQMKHGGNPQFSTHPLISGIQIKLPSGRKRAIHITDCLSILLAWHNAAVQMKLQCPLLVLRLPARGDCSSNGKAGIAQFLMCLCECAESKLPGQKIVIQHLKCLVQLQQQFADELLTDIIGSPRLTLWNSTYDQCFLDALGLLDCLGYLTVRQIALYFVHKIFGPCHRFAREPDPLLYVSEVARFPGRDYLQVFGMDSSTTIFLVLILSSKQWCFCVIWMPPWPPPVSKSHTWRRTEPAMNKQSSGHALAIFFGLTLLEVTTGYVRVMKLTLEYMIESSDGWRVCTKLLEMNEVMPSVFLDFCRNDSEMQQISSYSVIVWPIMLVSLQYFREVSVTTTSKIQFYSLMIEDP